MVSKRIFLLKKKIRKKRSQLKKLNSFAIYIISKIYQSYMALKDFIMQSMRLTRLINILPDLSRQILIYKQNLTDHHRWFLGIIPPRRNSSWRPRQLLTKLPNLTSVMGTLIRTTERHQHLQINSRSFLSTYAGWLREKESIKEIICIVERMLAMKGRTFLLPQTLSRITSREIAM